MTLARVSFPTRDELLVMVGDFTWDFGQKFFIEVDKSESACNFVWSSPSYQGDNSIVPFCGSYADWIKRSGSSFGRSKGMHIIENYCGSDVKYEPGLPD